MLLPLLNSPADRTGEELDIIFAALKVGTR